MISTRFIMDDLREVHERWSRDRRIWLCVIALATISFLAAIFGVIVAIWVKAVTPINFAGIFMSGMLWGVLISRWPGRRITKKTFWRQCGQRVYQHVMESPLTSLEDKMRMIDLIEKAGYDHMALKGSDIERFISELPSYAIETRMAMALHMQFIMAGHGVDLRKVERIPA